MDKARSGLEAELRVSPRYVLGSLVVVACVIYVQAEITADRWEAVDAVMTLSVLLFVAAALGWLIDSLWPPAGRWATLCLLASSIYGGAAILDAPEVLTLAALPVAVATPLLGFWASAAVALIEVFLLAAVRRYAGVAMSPTLLTVSYLGIAGTLGAMFAVTQPMHKLMAWLDDYFHLSVQHVEAARSRQEALERALEGFATVNRQLALANERAIVLRAAAEEAQRAKSTFVANVSHEFRTPLNMIIGLVDLMMEAPEAYVIVPSPEMLEDLEVIHRNCRHLASMIDDVLDLTRVEAGRLALHREDVDLGEVIVDTMDVVRPLAEKKGLTLTAAIPADLAPVTCDRTRIQQVIMNLVSNAARFTEEGGIHIQVSPDDGWVTVSVSDTGSGISPEETGLIFKPFVQGKVWHGKGGTGLGLSLSKQFVELHGGEMKVESAVGVGTTFSFALPVTRPLERVRTPDQAIQPDWIWHEPAFQAGREQGAQIDAKPCLVVQDQAGELFPWLDHYRDHVEFIISEDPAQTQTILASYSAQTVLVNTTDPAALVDLAESLKPVTGGTPIVVCSIPRRRDRARDAGALGHLIKPVTRDDLVAAMSAVPQLVRRVLIVDDDADVLRLFSRMLMLIQKDIDVITASDGEEALTWLRSDPPDLMLLDVVMPEMDGWQVLSAQQADPEIAAVPTFLISAQDSVDHRLTSSHLLVTADGGIPFSTVLAWSCELSNRLLVSGS